jgi:hypothetical protein
MMQMTAYFEAQVDFANGGVMLLGTQVDTADALADAAEQQVRKLAGGGSVTVYEVPPVEPLDVGAGRYGVQLSKGGQPVENRWYVTAKSQRDSAIHYLLAGYTVSLAKRLDPETARRADAGDDQALGFIHELPGLPIVNEGEVA